MVFSGIPFLFYFMPAFLLAYFISPKGFRNFILLLFSMLFYAWGEPKYIALLLISSVVDYVNGRCLEKYKGDRRKQRIFIIISVIVNLSLLGYFKYAGMIISNAPTLPLGISFFTFQTMSYSIDVYRGNVKAERNFINYMTYVCMFPQLVAGPIVRYADISVELKERKASLEGLEEGMIRFLKGLFKKVLIANQMGALWDIVLATENRSVLLAWLGLVAFALQIYYDFSGYSDMAIGLGRMMGFNYPENFNHPYIASSVSDFWRRWHMTLTTWFRDYVYIPLGGNRVSRKRNILNILIVWALTGFWHGAAFNFLFWGVYFGVILILEKFVLGGVISKLPKAVCHIYTLIIVLLGWMLFAIEDGSVLASYAADAFAFGATGFISEDFLYQLRNYAVVLFVAVVFAMPVMKSAARKLNNKKLRSILSVAGACAVIVLTVFCVAALVADTYNPFLYFRF